MSNYGKHDTQRIMNSAANIAVNKYMQKDNEEKLKALSEALNGAKKREDLNPAH